MPSRKRSKSRSKSRKGSKGCPPGKIRRVSYKRKGHLRRAYSRKSGSRVKGSYVDPARVPSSCVPDKGKPGKGQKTLPSINKVGVLRKHGYSVHGSQTSRHAAINKASKANNPLEIMRHLNLIRNYTAEADNKKILAQDVKYASKLYQVYKKKHGMISRGSSRKRSKSRSRKRSKSKSSKKRKRSKSKSSKKRKRSMSRSRSKKW